MSKPSTIQLSGLTSFECDELAELLAEQGVPDDHFQTLEQQPSSTDRAEDFGVTAAVVVISLSAIGVLGTWMLKKREEGTTTIVTKTFDENGNLVKEETIQLNSSSSEAPDTETIKETLAGLTGLGTESIKTVMGTV